MKHQVSLALAVAAILVIGAGNASAQRRVTGHIGLGFQPQSDDFVDHTSMPSNRETATIDGRYEVDGGQGVEAGVAVRVWRMLTVGVSLASAQRSSSTEISASLPHPFFFNTPRLATASADSLDRSDFSFSPSVGVQISRGPKLGVTVFAGPSWFRVSQQVISPVTVNESYPFDAVSLSTSQTDLSETVLGINLGATVAWYLSDSVGIGVALGYGAGSRETSIGDGDPFSLKAGGARIAAGVHFRSPSRRASTTAPSTPKGKG